jgi:gliding motility-associated-like protein
VILRVGDENDCFIPSLFTPNGDGTNDRLIIPCLETARFPTNRIVVFNEWGDAVFEAQPYLNNWEGTRNGKDLPVATYFYIVDFGDGRPVQTGFLILER